MRTSGSSWFLRKPLLIEFFRHALGGSTDIEQQLRKLQHCRENLDAVIYSLSNRQLAEDRRRHLKEILLRQQSALESCLQELGIVEHYQPDPPLRYYHSLEPLARAHLTTILNVSEEPEFYEILNIKAEEYLSQQKAFEEITKRLGFRDQHKLTVKSQRSAIIFTLSGSLIQLSEPIGPRGARHYQYQNIYGNAHPPEGVLVLDRDVQIGHRLRSVELTTSPVRLLRVAHRQISPLVQAQAFDRLTRALTSLVSRSSSLMAVLGWNFHDLTRGVRRVNLDAAERVYRQEYHDALITFEKHREAFEHELDGDARQKIEAELLTLCHYLQTGARELGFDACSLAEASGFITQDDLTYRWLLDKSGMMSITSTTGRPEVVLMDVSVGNQIATVQAPITLIGPDGAVVEVTKPLVKILRRSQRGL